MFALGVEGPGKRLATSKAQEKHNRFIEILGTGQGDDGSSDRAGGRL